MITITKKGKRPDILFDSGENIGKDKLDEETKSLLREYQSEKNDYDTGKKKFNFKKKLICTSSNKASLN